jgi:disulfide bond formation protein DsbB
MKSNNFSKILSAIEVLGISTIIIVAFIYQFFLDELPCPLCLLQRLGLLAIGLGFLLNMKYGRRSSHYSVSMLASIFTAAIALRQISLHITDPVGYGSAVFGMHMYTWSFVVSMIAIIYIAITMSFPHLYVTKDKEKNDSHPYVRFLTHTAFGIFLFLIVANVVTVFMLCGLSECPDNPVKYIF